MAPLSSESDMACSHQVALGMDKNTSVCMCLCVCHFKTQWNLAPTEDPDEETSCEQEAVCDFQCGNELVFVCLHGHMLLHASARVCLHTNTVHCSKRVMFSHSQQASSYCIMLRLWEGF